MSEIIPWSGLLKRRDDRRCGRAEARGETQLSKREGTYARDAKLRRGMRVGCYIEGDLSGALTAVLLLSIVTFCQGRIFQKQGPGHNVAEQSPRNDEMQQLKSLSFRAKVAREVIRPPWGPNIGTRAAVHAPPEDEG